MHPDQRRAANRRNGLEQLDAVVHDAVDPFGAGAGDGAGGEQLLVAFELPFRDGDRQRFPVLEVVIDGAGGHPDPVAADGVDLYALTHNETSTGVAMAPVRPAGADTDALVAVDATSAAGGVAWDPAGVDVYYFAPQKCFASDGGLWVAACSPAAVERIERIAASDRWRPASLDLGVALTNSRANQTYNTPALATLVLGDAHRGGILYNGGM